MFNTLTSIISNLLPSLICILECRIDDPNEISSEEEMEFESNNDEMIETNEDEDEDEDTTQP